MNVNNSAKPVILLFVGYYLPGYKAGGILRTIVNTVDCLRDQFDFLIVTRDRDLGDDKPFPDLNLNEWLSFENCKVYYITPDRINPAGIRQAINGISYDTIFLNSFFDPLTFFVLYNRMLGRISPGRTIVSPRGEFAWASLKQKFLKKFIYISVVKTIRLFRTVEWLVSSEFENKDFKKVLNIRSKKTTVLLDLPSTLNRFPERADSGLPEGSLRVIFLSRIVPEKNLDYALNILQKVKTNIIFDIYGPVENLPYWNKCKDIIETLPSNISVQYKGVVVPDMVFKTFIDYDLFFLPSGGENYGHVIAEALTVGTPVLISDQTPWKNLALDGLGWEFPLSDEESFIAAIEGYAMVSKADRLRKSESIKMKSKARLNDPTLIQAYRNLFNNYI